MRKLLVLVALIPFLFAGDQAPEFEAHEWGVFMFYQGLGADILAAHEPDLPQFVARLEDYKEQQKKCSACGIYPCKCKIRDIEPREEYLKPVINFFSKDKLSVNVSVNTHGKHTVWYPKHTSISKDGTRLDWSIEITPIKPEKRLKEPKGCSWWETARDTDSAYVVTKDDVEKFIFYEGEDSKLEAEIEIKKTGDKIQLINKSSHKYNNVLVVFNKKIIHLEKFAKSQDITFDKELIDQKTAMAKLENMLIAEGLNEKEAKGVAKIWEKDFFETDGLHVLYMMSREKVDTTLPLTIEPKPKKFVRAMIGCAVDTDLIINKLIKQLADDDPAKRDSATRTLIRMGQKIKSHLEKALKETKDPEVKSRLDKIIDEINKASSDKPKDDKWIKEGKCPKPPNCCDIIDLVKNKQCIRCESNNISNDREKICQVCANQLGICSYCQKSVK